MDTKPPLYSMAQPYPWAHHWQYSLPFASYLKVVRDFGTNCKDICSSLASYLIYNNHANSSIYLVHIIT